MDTLNKVDADFLHQLDMDYKPLTSPYTWDLVDYKEQPKLKTGDIVTIRPDLTTSSSTLKGQYKVISYNTKNGQYGIVPVRSLFDLPMYYTREELILVPLVNKEESFLYKVGDVVSFKVTSSLLPSSSRTLKGLITARYKEGRKYYKIEGLFDEKQYEVHESDIIERLCTSTSESEQQKAVNMENSTEEPKIRIGDIVQFKLIGGDEIRIGQIEEGPSASINCFIIKDLRDKCRYLVEGSNIIKKITYYTVPDCKSNKAELTISTAELLSAAKSLEDIGKIIDSINEEKPLNIKIAKKQIKLNFKN